MTLFHVNMSKLNTNLRYSSLKKKKKNCKKQKPSKTTTEKKKTNHKQETRNWQQQKIQPKLLLTMLRKHNAYNSKRSK